MSRKNRTFNYTIDPVTGCWLLDSHKANAGGYIYIRRKYNNGYLHRLIFKENYGDIPPGSQVRHTCGNKRCINPDHLELY